MTGQRVPALRRHVAPDANEQLLAAELVISPLAVVRGLSVPVRALYLLVAEGADALGQAVYRRRWLDIRSPGWLVRGAFVRIHGVVRIIMVDIVITTLVLQV